MISNKIHIEGRVQGVGFRPFIYLLANSHKLKGQVSNGTDGVRIVISGEEENINAFLQGIEQKAPPKSVISSIKLDEIPYQPFNDFRIVESSENEKTSLLISPDFGICDDCRNELHSKENRRYEYPFITCTQCGPRYSIINKLPYDRDNTSMETFNMCEKCQTEYEDISDRRFYSQTNSCKSCSINLELRDDKGEVISTANPIQLCIRAIQNGKLLAVKGIGGYLIIGSASDPGVVKRLRDVKKRPQKPFALMYPNEHVLQEDLLVKPEDLELLKSHEAPILLLPVKEEVKSGIDIQLIAPGLNKIGAMLPYAPLFELLLSDLKSPVIATSANFSHDPIMYNNQEAQKGLNGICDLYLHNDREIAFPQDDSVLNTSSNGNNIFIRRSRGYAPIVFNGALRESKPALAMGADMKGAFGIQHEEITYMSQFLGDLELLNSQLRYEEVLDGLRNMLNAAPAVILADSHQGYFSTQKGIELASTENIPIKFIQHHKAHFASVLAENNLLNEDNILGIIWDGLGFGEDNNLWGGESFLYRNGEITRESHLPYFPAIAGNKMSLEPRISAMSLLYNQADAQDFLHSLFDNREFNIYRTLAKSTKLKTSSMGRLFDAISCILNIGNINSYEGESAMKLETLADNYFNGNYNRPELYLDLDSALPYPVAIAKRIHELYSKSENREFLSAAFHWSLVDIIEKEVYKMKIQKIAFSGGVFQNALLNDIIQWRLASDFELYFHKELSPNDECIPYGQLAMNLIDEQKIPQELNLESEYR